MKEIIFKGNSLDELKAFPAGAKRQAGHNLDLVQKGIDPDDWKPISTIGIGVKEIRIRDDSGAYRVIYVANFENAVYVLAAFKKKTQKTPKSVIKLAKRYYGELNNGR